MCSGPSDKEKQAQAQQAEFSKQLADMMKTEFANQQDVLKFLLPQLQQMATNPEGFGAVQYKALQSQLINDVGTQFAGVQKAANERFAVSNEAGLPSGVQEQVNAGIASSAAGAESTGLTSLAISNEQLKQQQQQQAFGELGSIESGLGGQAIGAGSAGSQSAQASFNEALQMAKQGSFWKSILGGGLTGLGQYFGQGNFIGGALTSGGAQTIGG